MCNRPKDGPWDVHILIKNCSKKESLLDPVPFNDAKDSRVEVPREYITGDYCVILHLNAF